MFLSHYSGRKLNYFACLSYIVLLVCSSKSYLEAIVFDEVSSLHVWITISSLANKDPNNDKALIFRQVELNWINAPLEDENDYIGLYLDSQPEDEVLPVSVYRLNGQPSGQIITDYYLPTIDFYNLTVNGSNGHGELPGESDSSQQHPESFESKALHLPREAHSGPRLRRSDEFSGHNIQTFNHQTQPPANIQSSLSEDIVFDDCVGYCLAYHSRNKILAKNCLKTNANWMRDSFQIIGPRTITSLMIPGTHNSGTYPKQLDKTVLQMISKYQMNQDENIFNQLVYGIRHLDLRVGYTKVKQRTERLWIYHDIFRTEISLNEVFEQIRRFLELTSNEIIIIDFHRFTVGFQNEYIATQRERHSELIDLIFEQLGKYIVPSYLGQNVPIEDYMAMGKRLIIGYADRASIIPVSRAEQMNTMFASLNNRSAKLAKQQIKQQVMRNGSDSDAASRQENIQNASINTDSVANLQSRSENSQALEQAEKRDAGSRLFNRIKSLKVISKSFSKRSIDEAVKSHPDRHHSDKSLSRARLLSSTGGNDNENGLGELSSVSRAALFFGPVRHLWPNKDTIEGLAQYMNETTCRKYFGDLRSMMAELTPTVFGAISDKYDGNRKLSQQINRPITDWIRDRWLHCINIVASDFFLGNDLIRLAIYANKVRVLHKNIHLNLNGQCKSFRKVEHLLDKSKIPIQFAYHPDQYSSDESIDYAGDFKKSNDIIMHTSSDGNQIFLKPLSSSFNSYQAYPASREKRDSFVENVSDGLSNFVSSVKRLLNL